MTLNTTFSDASGRIRLEGSLGAPGATVGDVLTVQADGSLAPAAGGGSQTVKQSDPVSLSAAQIKAIDATGYELVPAPDAGKMLVPLTVVAHYEPGATAYTLTEGNIFIGWADNNGQVVLAELEGALEGFIGSNDEGWSTDPVAAANEAPASAAGSAIMIATNGSAPTLGDGTLTISVVYEEITLP